jgi:hypothetical protein
MRTVGGERRLSNTNPKLEKAYRLAPTHSRRLMKLSGAQRRPIMKEREKLRVASVERDNPKSNRANDLIKRYCCGTRGVNRPKPLRRRAARKRGKTMSTATTT